MPSLPGPRVRSKPETFAITIVTHNRRRLFQRADMADLVLKGGFSFAAKKQTAGTIWQEGYHAHRVTCTEDFLNQTRYITNNPRSPDDPHVHTAHPHLVDPLNI